MSIGVALNRSFAKREMQLSRKVKKKQEVEEKDRRGKRRRRVS